MIPKELKFLVENLKVNREERNAGILHKQVKLILPEGFVLCLADLEKIKFDKHQRDLDLAHANNLFENWNPLFTTLPICSLRHNDKGDLTLFGEDGQHTGKIIDWKGAAFELANGQKVIHVLCHFSLTDSQAAELFAVKNTSSKKVGEWDSFYAHWLGKSQIHVDIMECAKNHVLTTPITLHHNEPKGDADLQHCNEYIKIRKKHGKAFIDSLFRLHKRCFYLTAAMRKKNKIKIAGKKSQKLGYNVAFLRSLVLYIKQEQIHPHDLIPVFKSKDAVKEIMDAARKIGVKVQSDRPDQGQIRTAIGNYVKKVKRAA